MTSRQTKGFWGAVWGGPKIKKAKEVKKALFKSQN
jgi:hypothetical protein